MALLGLRPAAVKHLLYNNVRRVEHKRVSAKEIDAEQTNDDIADPSREQIELAAVIKNILGHDRLDVVTIYADAEQAKADVKHRNEANDASDDLWVLLLVRGDRLNWQDDTDALISVHSEADRLRPAISDGLRTTTDALAAAVSFH